MEVQLQQTVVFAPSTVVLAAVSVAEAGIRWAPLCCREAVVARTIGKNFVSLEKIVFARAVFFML